MEYPDSKNRSFVRLRCVNEGSSPLKGAVFFKDGKRLISGSERDKVTIITDSSNGEIVFRFTQEQEGAFYCISRGGQSSAAVSLAGTGLGYWDLWMVVEL